MQNLVKDDLNKKFEPFLSILNFDYFLEFQCKINKKNLNFYLEIIEKKNWIFNA